jgi:hypothetical protein
MARRINSPLGKALHESLRATQPLTTIAVARVSVPDAIAEIDEIMAGLGEAQRQLVANDMRRKYGGA